MITVRIYTKTTCPHSIGAKELLRGKGISFVEHQLWFTRALARLAKLSWDVAHDRTSTEVLAMMALLSGCRKRVSRGPTNTVERDNLRT